jgi:hypothetical protein
MKLITTLVISALVVPVAEAADWYSTAVNSIEKARTFARRAERSYQAGDLTKTASFALKVHSKANAVGGIILNAPAPHAETATEFYTTRRKAASNCAFADTDTSGITSPDALQTLINDGTVDVADRLRKIRKYLAKCRQFVDAMDQF